MVLLPTTFAVLDGDPGFIVWVLFAPPFAGLWMLLQIAVTFELLLRAGRWMPVHGL